MPFPWLSSFGFWCYAIGGVLVFSSIFFGIAPDSGWFMDPPLTGPTYSPAINTDIWVLGLGFVEITAVAAAIELSVWPSGSADRRARRVKLALTRA
jgi:cytochrome c oxidase subunit I+III